MAPFASPRCTTTSTPAKSRTAARSLSATVSAPVSTTTASRPCEPEATAMATQTPTAETCSDGRSTVAAAYVLPSESRTAAPSAALVRARVARARVTSFLSSADSSLIAVVFLVLLGGDARDEHGADAVAAAGGGLGLEAQAVRLDHRARDRDPAEVLGHQAADAVDVLLLDVEAEELVEVVDRVAGGHPDDAVVEGLDLDLLRVVLVRDLADDLLEDVLDRHQAGGAAVLVDDDGDVLSHRLHLREQRVDGLGVGHEVRRAHHLVDALRELHVGCLEVAAHDVLEVGDADDVVEVLADDRHPGEAAAQEERERLAQVLVTLDVDDVGARHHHLTRDRVAELEHVVDHLPLARLDQRRRLRHVDQLAELGLRRERAFPEALARGERVADQDQQLGQRSEDHGHERQ